MSNPYEPPQTNIATHQPAFMSGSATDVSREKLRDLATDQRRLMLAILAYFGMVIFIGATADRKAPTPKPAAGQQTDNIELSPVDGLLMLVVAIFGGYSMYRLATHFYSHTMAVMMGFVILAPFIGLIVMFVNSSKATAIFKQHNIPVGLLGANPNRI
jgi:hypothetical protein